MDGSAFKIEQIDAGVALEQAPALEAVASMSSERPGWPDAARQWLSLGAAAAIHLALLALMLPMTGDTHGDDGVALETVAVSLVDSVPQFSAPETPVSEAAEATPPTEEQPPEAIETKPQEDREKAEDKDDKPEPQKQALALDLPPEPEPQPDVPTLPARVPEVEQEPVPQIIEQPPEPKVERAERKETKEVAQPQQAEMPAPAILPSVSSAEAAPGVVKAYAGQISKLLDRQKPKSRGMKGQVRIGFVVGAAGMPEQVLVLSSNGTERLNATIVEAVQRMTFPPPPPEMSVRQRTFHVSFSLR